MGSGVSKNNKPTRLIQDPRYSVPTDKPLLNILREISEKQTNLSNKDKNDLVAFLRIYNKVFPPIYVY